MCQHVFYHWILSLHNHLHNVMPPEKGDNAFCSFIHPFFFSHLPSQAFYFYKKAVTSLLGGVHWKLIGLWQVDSTVTKQRHVPLARTANSRFSLNYCLNLLTRSYSGFLKTKKNTNLSVAFVILTALCETCLERCSYGKRNVDRNQMRVLM